MGLTLPCAPRPSPAGSAAMRLAFRRWLRLAPNGRPALSEDIRTRKPRTKEGPALPGPRNLMRDCGENIPPQPLAPPYLEATALLGGDDLGLSEHRLVGLHGVLGEVRVELADLRSVSDEAFVGGLEVLGLDLDGLVEGLGGDELLGDGRSLLESLLGVVGRLGGDGLDALLRSSRSSSWRRRRSLC